MWFDLTSLFRKNGIIKQLSDFRTGMGHLATPSMYTYAVKILMVYLIATSGKCLSCSSDISFMCSMRSRSVRKELLLVYCHTSHEECSHPYWTSMKKANTPKNQHLVFNAIIERKYEGNNYVLAFISLDREFPYFMLLLLLLSRHEV